MGITKPYFRICRPSPDGRYVGDLNDTYVRDQRYAGDRIDLIRGYHLLEKELLHIFEFVEPADANLGCYSHHLYALLLRASTEFEANAKAILTANGWGESRSSNIKDYHKLNDVSRLSEYMVTLPIWDGHHRRIMPFSEWGSSHRLPWYQDYNAVKHNRGSAFPKASLGNAVTAVAAVFVIIFSQFNFLAFDPHHIVNMLSDDNGVLSHDACLLHIELPTSWKSEECYDFDWKVLAGDPSPFQQYQF